MSSPVGIATIAVSGTAFLLGLWGLQSGRSIPAWSVVLALAGAGIAAGALLVQDQVGAASWFLAPVAGAAISLVHGRVLFARGGPFRT